ncbi:hypothetical protein BV898_18905 [Hypsibius exemplaris]|uniref:Bulb-type lectin domain-containing protein n=1 Tax=Hypsibius exemplaris TaxID=2072580 RepID=A0A9X6NIA7_HYPEX|nr:hypothetical protein BV898_18905 [Hypsibius exemplaris]
MGSFRVLKVWNQELGPGDSLGVGESIWSPNRTAQLLMQADGNLVVYRQCDCQAIWDSNTNKNNSSVRPAKMEADGNLVIYDINGAVLWASGTHGKRFAGARLRLEDTGSLCIEQTRGLCLWRSGGIALCHPAYAPTFENAQGSNLEIGRKLNPRPICVVQQRFLHTDSSNGRRNATQQAVRWGNDLFHSPNSDNPESIDADMSLSAFTMNETGNLQVTYVGKSPVIFKDIQSRLFGTLTTLSADLRLRDDCQLCVFKEGVCLWYGHALTVPCPTPETMLKSGHSLRTGEEIFSPQLNVKLTMRPEGDLVLTRQCDAEFIWYTYTDNDKTDPPTAVTMQEDGNLAIYNSKKVLVWNSGTAGREFAGADLQVNNDGTLCIAKNGSHCLWTSGGYGVCDPLYSKKFDDAKVILWPGESSNLFDTAYSRQNTCRLSARSDRDLVLTRMCDGEKIYSVKNESSLLNKRNIVQGLGINVEGNLVMYTTNRAKALLQSMRRNAKWDASDGANLRLSDDCILCVYKNGACLWTSSGRAYACPVNNSDGEARFTANDDNLPNPAQTRQLTRGKSSDLLMREVLESGEALFVGQSLWSPRRNVQMKMERTGDLAIYRQCDNNSIWSSATSETNSNPQSVVMQENGNLAIYNGKGLLVWSSGTFQPRFVGAKLRLEDTGSLCIYTQGECLWESGGFGLCEPTPSPAFQNGTVITNVRRSLNRGDSFTSNTQKGSCSLTAQADGKLVLVRSCDDTVVFSIRHGAGFTENLGWDKNALVYSFDLTDNGDLAVTYNDSVRHTFKKISSLFNVSTNMDLRMNDDCRMCVFDNGTCLWTAHAVTYPCPSSGTTPTKAYQEVAGGVLAPGESLHIGQVMWSPSRTTQLRMQADGNLVVYRECDHRVIWSSRSNYSDSRSRPLSLLMQSDGNLVMYDARHTLLWASSTAGDPFTASRLRLDDTGSLCIGKARGECLWKSGGMGLCRPVDASQFQDAQVILSSGKKMTKGQTSFSRNKACILTLQENGDLLLYRQCDRVTIFSVRHGLDSPEGLGYGSDAFVSQLAIDKDGRFHVNEATQYRETLFLGIKTPAKSSSDNITLADLRLSDDCQLCVFKDGACLWFGHAKTYPCPVTLAGSVLKSGQTLSAGQSLYSPRHNVQLKMENNGNLWLRRGCDEELAWGILLGDVLAMDIPSEVTMQADGNLALYNSNKVLAWDSGTAGRDFAGADLRVNNDGTLCIAKNESRCLWTSGGYGLCDPLYSKTFDDARVILKSGERLNRNSIINSTRATCSLQFQADGDVVLYRKCDGATIFSFKKEVIFLRNMNFLLQFGISTHGDLEAYGLNGTVTTLRNVTKRMQWDTTDGADLRLHDDCVLCVYRNGSCLWISSGLSYGCPLMNSTEPAAVSFLSEHQTVAPQKIFNAPRQPAEVLESGQSLSVGQSLWSPSRNVQLKMESTGDLVVYRVCDNQSIWSSASSFAYMNNIDNPQSVIMQENGNLAIYRLDGVLVWSSGTFSPRFAGARLRLDDTGALCIFTDKGCLWESGGFALCQPLPSPTFEKAEGRVLSPPGYQLQFVRKSNRVWLL